MTMTGARVSYLYDLMEQLPTPTSWGLILR